MAQNLDLHCLYMAVLAMVKTESGLSIKICMVGFKDITEMHLVRLIILHRWYAEIIVYVLVK